MQHLSRFTVKQIRKFIRSMRSEFGHYIENGKTNVFKNISVLKRSELETLMATDTFQSVILSILSAWVDERQEKLNSLGKIDKSTSTKEKNDIEQKQRSLDTAIDLYISADTDFHTWIYSYMSLHFNS